MSTHNILFHDKIRKNKSLKYPYELSEEFPKDSAGLGDSVGFTSDWRSGGHGFDSWVRQYSLVVIVHEKLSAIIHSADSRKAVVNFW